MSPVQFVAVVVIIVAIAISHSIVVEIIVVIVQLGRGFRVNGAAITLGNSRCFGPIRRLSGRVARFAAATASAATATLATAVFASLLLLHYAGNFNLRKFLVEPFGNFRILRQKAVFVELSAGSVITIIVDRT